MSSKRLRHKEALNRLPRSKKARQAAQSRITEVEEDLLTIVTKHDMLKASREKDAAKLKKLKGEHKEAFSQANVATEVIRQAIEISVGKPYLP